MPTATSCTYQGNKITIAQALKIKKDKKLQADTFLCVSCAKPVSPHSSGTNNSAHFEHRDRNPNCEYSHPNNKNTYSSPGKLDFDSDEAREGYESDRKILNRKRNSGLAAKCKKRDKYTCQVCGFKLRVGKKYVAECHHAIPLASGERTVNLDELVTLCPTCHRIAHTRRIPYGVDELKKIVGKK